MVFDEYEVRCSDFQKIEEIVEYISYQFKSFFNVSAVSNQISEKFSLQRSVVALEMLALKADAFFKAQASENDSWKLVDSKYCNIKKPAVNIHPCFSSIYLCESAFSFTNAIKTKSRAVLNECHFADRLKLS